MFYKIESYNLEFLKWIAILGMFIDHFSKLIFPTIDHIPFFFEFGRISFPLFAFILVYNYLYNTKSKENYLKRLLIFALISQPFFSYAFNTFVLNIFFVLLIGLLCIYLIEKGIEFDKKVINFSLATIILVSSSNFVDYQPFGIAVIVSLYFVFIYKKVVFWLIFIIFLILANHYTYSLNNGLLGLFLGIILFHLTLYIVLIKNKIKIPRINKWFFYSFYPLHLVLILIIKYYGVFQ